jgi:hypothetical protein
MNPSNSNQISQIFISNIFIHLIQIKMIHFQTNQYSIHKSSDDYYTSLNINFDKFIEVSQGIFGKTTFSNIQINTIEFNNICSILDNFIQLLIQMERFCKEHSDLLNILGEMKADTNQFKYLLTFK